VTLTTHQRKAVRAALPPNLHAGFDRMVGMQDDLWKVKDAPDPIAKLLRDCLMDALQDQERAYEHLARRFVGAAPQDAFSTFLATVQHAAEEVRRHGAEVSYQVTGRSMALHALEPKPRAEVRYVEDRALRCPICAFGALKAQTKPKSPVCSHCKDTHKMTLGETTIMCTHCPTPCEKCLGTAGPYCASTPCGCSCHLTSFGPQQKAKTHG